MSQPKPTHCGISTLCLACTHTNIQRDFQKHIHVCFAPTYTRTYKHANSKMLRLYKINQGVLPGFRIEEVQSQTEKLDIALFTMGHNLFMHSFVTVFNWLLFSNNNGITDALPVLQARLQAYFTCFTSLQMLE